MTSTTGAATPDFWLSSGHHLLDRDAAGRLVVTDDYLRLYLARPEIVPPADACIVERALHAKLLRDPRSPIAAGEIADMADRDARDNWRHFTTFRDHLAAHATLEAAYVALARSAKVSTPPLFLGQLVHVILRNVLDGETDAMRVRAAEMFYRTQRLSLKDGAILVGDEELIDGETKIDAHASPLAAMFGDARARDLDVLTAPIADRYWARSDAHDFVVDFRPGQPARSALAHVIAAWVGHLVGSVVTVDAVDRVEDRAWAWFIGLDQEATAIGNALWAGREPAADGRERIVALFQLTFTDPGDALPKVAGRPVTLILAATPDHIIRIKPQNLIAGLPLATRS